MSMSRIPLQEYPDSFANQRVTETPNTKGFAPGSAMTTPPETTSNSRKKRMSIGTPIARNNDGSSNILSNLILLSPAFLSPQKKHNNGSKQHVQVRGGFSINDNHFTHPAPPKQPAFEPLGAAAAAAAASEEKPTRKKSKKSKKDAKDYPFDLESNEKPPYSYATLIGMSIMSHPDRKLTLSLIYSWISETFKYYKREDVGWQNLIRHNLSLNKAFVKGEKSKDGKGHFWFIEEGCEDQFLKSRNSKKHLYQEIMDQINGSNASHSNQNHNQNHDNNFNGQNSTLINISSTPQMTVQSQTSLYRSKSSIYLIPSSPNIAQDEDQSYRMKRPASNLNEAAEYHNDDEDDEFHALLDAPSKRRALRRTQDSHFHPHLLNSPLGAPFLQWGGEVPSLVVEESPNKPLIAAKNVSYTSSFSCNLNLELSPIRTSETGPLLEPMTPVNIYKKLENHNILSVILGHGLHGTTKDHRDEGLAPGAFAESIVSSKLVPHPHASSAVVSGIHTTPHGLAAPATHISGSASSSSSSHNVHLQPVHLPPPHHISRTPKSVVRTPLRSLRSPQTASMMKKLWNSPSYLEDFYHSPLVGSTYSNLASYDEDDLMLRAFESPGTVRKPSGRKLLNDFKAELVEKDDKK